MDSIFTDYNFPEKLGISVDCLICGEPIPMGYIGDSPQICDKCKAAVMKIRNQEEKESKTDEN